MHIEDQLAHHLLFRSLSAEQRSRACMDARHIHLERNAPLFRQGEKATAFYVLVDGLIKLSRVSVEGNEKIIEIIDSGGTFAEALMFLNSKRYPVTAQAIKDSTLIRISNARYLKVLEESNATCLTLLGDLSRRIHGLIGEIDKLTLHDANCRVANYLIARMAESGVRFALEMPKQALASRLAVKPETFSRIIKQLCHDGLIHVERSHIQILDAEALRSLAQPACDLADDLGQSFRLNS